MSPEGADDVPRKNPVVDSDLTLRGTRDTNSDAMICPSQAEEAESQAEPLGAPPSEATQAPPEDDFSELLRHRPEWDSLDSAFG